MSADIVPLASPLYMARLYVFAFFSLRCVVLSTYLIISEKSNDYFEKNRMWQLGYFEIMAVPFAYIRGLKLTVTGGPHKIQRKVLDAGLIIFPDVCGPHV